MASLRLETAASRSQHFLPLAVGASQLVVSYVGQFCTDSEALLLFST
jgi:hypothetical protein